MNSIKIWIVTLTIAFTAFVFLGLSTDYTKVAANVTGPPPQFTNAPGEGNCTACHVDFAPNTGEGNITLAGIPTQYEPNQEIQITVTVNDADAVVYGFQLTAIGEQGQMVGTFTLPKTPVAQTQIVDGFVDTNTRRYVEHTVNGTAPVQFGTKSWTFTWTAPTTPNGIVSFYAAGNAANSNGEPSGDNIYLTSTNSSPADAGGSSPFDFDGDGKTDVSIFRPGTSPSQWWYLRSSDFSNAAFAFGTATDTLVPADFTGDGVTDLAFWRESTGEWFVLRSEDSSFFSVPFGSAGDIPAPGDFDGDGQDDTAVFRPSTSTWFIQNSSGGTTIIPFGVAEDRPVVADYDGDGKDDIAIYRPSVNQWWLNRSTDGVLAYEFGTAEDKTTQGDFTGDGKADSAFFRPSTGEWFVIRSEDLSFFSVPFGISTDIPTPGDYDGDGTTDTAVFRPSNNNWFVQGSTSGFFQVGFGITNDIPLPNVYSVP